jgi:DNA modification methylase
MTLIDIRLGDCRDLLKDIPGESIHTVVTSPPYWAQRDYGTDAGIGLEDSVDDWIEAMVEVFREVWRVLRPDGTVWLNLGDKYAGPGGDLKEKDLMGLPWRVAFALQADGWWLRSGIVWDKPNPTPEPVMDRPGSSHEFVFLLARARRYYYDATAVRVKSKNQSSRNSGRLIGGPNRTNPTIAYAFHYDAQPTRQLRDVWRITSVPFPGSHFATFPPALAERPILAGTSEYGVCVDCGAPWKRLSVMRASPASDREAKMQRTRNIISGGETGSTLGGDHTVETTGWEPTCDHAGADVRPATVLDPFSGAGTTGLVAQRLGRDYIGLELNPEYVQMAIDRIADDVKTPADRQMESGQSPMFDMDALKVSTKAPSGWDTNTGHHGSITGRHS